MPKAMHYKANSVIYFKGDAADRIYILKSGRVSLTSNDIETGQEVHDYIQTGEFFGVKSALGKYPREENAVVLSDTDVVIFSVPEFEQLVSQNTRIIMKMLKVFSNQLRRIHAKVSNLLAEEEQVDPEEGLFQNAQYFMRKKQYRHALYAFNKYLTYYPSGRFHEEANRLARTAEEYAQRYGEGRGPVPEGVGKVEVPKPQTGRSMSDSARRYYEAVGMLGRQEYEKALDSFKELVKTAEEQEYVVKALFEIGRTLFYMKHYDAAVKHFTQFLQKYPKATEMPDALFYIGQSYQEAGDNDRAQTFYKKILSLQEIDNGLVRKVNKAVRSLEET
ncbi:MAG: cyclic nucleotide-binding domain-containing protein [Spirochaetaceae bacterium]